MTLQVTDSVDKVLAQASVCKYLFGLISKTFEKYTQILYTFFEKKLNLYAVKISYLSGLVKKIDIFTCTQFCFVNCNMI